MEDQPYLYSVRPSNHQAGSPAQNLQSSPRDSSFWALQDDLFESLGGTEQSVLDSDIFMSLDSPPSHGGHGDYVQGHIAGDDDLEGQINAHGARETNNAFLVPERCSEDSHSIIPDHYGSGYWLSLCSAPGVAWINHQVGASEFTETAQKLTASWTKQLRLERDEPVLQSAEPEPDLAWKYCNAYFERSYDTLVDAVYRPEFERHLRAHHSGKFQYHDPTWYALRNVVYASGCRVYHSENPTASFPSIHREAWNYFTNSLSVHSELLLRSPSLRAVRALLAMALFAEGLGSPALSSGLIANAALLAQSLGLHRQAPNAASPTDCERKWVFWAVYCCEKHIAQRCGRPSVISDDEIRCDIPNRVHQGSTIEIETFKYIIQSCQIYSRVYGTLMSTKALHEPPAKMLEIVMEFDRQLRTWQESIPIHIRPKDRLKQFQMPFNTRLLALMLIQCSYYDLLMIVHTIFAYPWITESFGHDLPADLQAKITAQITTSSNVVANSARNLIVIARNLDMHRACTQSFMLHFPMHAFVNLFTYVIRFPRLHSVRSDLALLDVGAGYFGQMEFVTGSRLSFPFARDIAAMARKTVDTVDTSSSLEVVDEISTETHSSEAVTPSVTQHPQADDFGFDSWTA